MPLPQMTGDPGTLLGGDAAPPAGPDSPSTGPSSSGQATSPTDQQDQVRGAMQALGSLKQQTESTLKAIATQFPGVTQAATRLQSAFDEALSNLMRDLVRKVQQPAPPGPTILR